MLYNTVLAVNKVEIWKRCEFTYSIFTISVCFVERESCYASTKFVKARQNCLQHSVSPNATFSRDNSVVTLYWQVIHTLLVFMILLHPNCSIQLINPPILVTNSYERLFLCWAHSQQLFFPCRQLCQPEITVLVWISSMWIRIIFRFLHCIILHTMLDECTLELFPHWSSNIPQVWGFVPCREPFECFQNVSKK